MYAILDTAKVSLNINDSTGQHSVAATDFWFVPKVVTSKGRKILVEITDGQLERFQLWRAGLVDASIVQDAVADDIVTLLAAGWKKLFREDRQQVISLAHQKLSKLPVTDAKSAALIVSGFTVDGKTFSASDTAQLKWLGMYTSRADLSYPVTVPTKDDTQFVSLIEASDVVVYYQALLARIQTVLAGGVTLKAQIAAATTQAALDAIVDDRT